MPNGPSQEVLDLVDEKDPLALHDIFRQFFQVDNSDKVPEKFVDEGVMVRTMKARFDEVGDRGFAEFWEKAVSKDGVVDWGRKPLYTPVMDDMHQLTHVVHVNGDPGRVPSHIRIDHTWQFNDGISDMHARFEKAPACHYVHEFFEDKTKGPHKFKLDPKGNHLKALAEKVVLDEEYKRKELEASKHVELVSRSKRARDVALEKAREAGAQMKRKQPRCLEYSPPAVSSSRQLVISPGVSHEDQDGVPR